MDEGGQQRADISTVKECVTGKVLDTANRRSIAEPGKEKTHPVGRQYDRVSDCYGTGTDIIILRSTNVVKGLRVKYLSNLAPGAIRKKYIFQSRHFSPAERAREGVPIHEAVNHHEHNFE